MYIYMYIIIIVIRYVNDSPPPVPEHRTRAQTEGNPLGVSTPPMSRRHEPQSTPGPAVSVRVSDARMHARTHTYLIVIISE